MVYVVVVAVTLIMGGGGYYHEVRKDVNGSSFQTMEACQKREEFLVHALYDKIHEPAKIRADCVLDKSKMVL